MGLTSWRWLFSLSVLAALGCTKANVGFDVLNGDNVPQPLFSGQTSETLTTTSAVTSFAVSGSCDYKISSIVGQASGVNSAQSLLSSFTVGSPTLSCQSNGTFSFTLKSLTDLGFEATENQTYAVKLYGVTTAGLSKASTIYIKYASPNGNAPRRMVLTSGGTESSSSARQATSGNFRAEIRVDHRMPAYADATVSDAMTTMSSSHFKAKIGAAASAD